MATKIVKLLSIIAVASALVLSASAAPVAVEPTADCAWTCGSVCYDNDTIDAALAKGYDLEQSGDEIHNYPHKYNDREGFDFPTSGPWYEFPIMSSDKVYTGGSPGPDRVIFDTEGSFDMLITHTGAEGNNFVACTEG